MYCYFSLEHFMETPLKSFGTLMGSNHYSYTLQPHAFFKIGRYLPMQEIEKNS